MAGAALLATLALAAGFAWFAVAAGQPGPPPAHADGIVALTGGPDRIETALHLLAEGRADLLLISGVAHGAALPDLARRAGLDPATLASRVTLGRAAKSTVGNAEETAEWATRHGVRDLIVVTAGYHMPRALLELRRSLPGASIQPVPVQPAQTRLPVLVAEYGRLLAAACGVSRWKSGLWEH